MRNRYRAPLACAVIAAGLVLAASVTRSAADKPYGNADWACRADEQGPALRVDVDGLKDRTGVLKLELYPGVKRDFLADDNELIRAGKVFRRVRAPVPAIGSAQLCVRVPAPGRYAVLILHDRSGEAEFNNLLDGLGLPGNPKQLTGAPALSQAEVEIGNGIGHSRVVLMYRKSLLSFAPIQG